MSNNIPESHLFTPEDLSTFEYNQIFSCCSIWLEEGMDGNIATFDLLVRDMPENRNFLVFGGLEEIMEGIKKWKYTDEQIQFLLENHVITRRFAEYLRTFAFSGDIWAMNEGSVFFPGEPIIRVTAPIIEANLLTMFLVNAVASNTPFLTKAVRCVLAASPADCNGIYGVRAHSFESSMKSARNSYIAGTKGIALPSFYAKYKLPMPLALTIGYHAFIKSFPDELSAMRAIAKYFPEQMITMIDTYEVKQGIRNAIQVAKELKASGGSLKGIMIDSGDLLEISTMARNMLDDAGLTDVQISLASNLDEYKIHALKQQECPANAYLVVTEGVTVADAPKLEVVYKMAQIQDGEHVEYTAKLATGKVSYPGKKQVFRIGSDGDTYDVVGLESEKIDGRSLLVEVIRSGECVYELPTLDEIKSYLKKELEVIPKDLLSISNKKADYRVDTSQGLKDLLETVKQTHLKEYGA